MRNVLEEGCGSNYQGREYGPIKEKMTQTEKDRTKESYQGEWQRNMAGNLRRCLCVQGYREAEMEALSRNIPDN